MFKYKTYKFPLLAFGLYLLIFTLFFISYPINNSLPSDLDSWYYIAKYNHFNNLIHAFISNNSSTTTFFYPDTFPSFNGEPSMGLYFFWVPFKLLTGSDLWAYFIVFVGVYSLNGFSVFNLIKTYDSSISSSIAFLGGFLFNFNMFMFANLDNINTLYWGSGILAISCFLKLQDKEKDPFIIIFLMSILLFHQLTCSVYNFLYTLIILFTLFCFNFRTYFSRIFVAKKLNLLLVFIGSTLCFFYLYIIVIYPDKSNHWNFSQDLNTLDYVSIKLNDFLRVLPNSLHSKEDSVYWVLQYKSMFLGYFFTIALIVSLFFSFPYKKQILTISIISLIIGMGAFIELGNIRILLPLGWFFETFDLFGFYRFPYRIFMIIILMGILIICYSFQRLKKVIPPYLFNIFLAFFTIVFVLENMPLSRNYFEFKKFKNEGEYLKQVLKGYPSKNVLILPVVDFINDGGNPNIYRSEHIYMYWQTFFGHNLLNGQAGHIPPHILDLVEVLYYKELSSKSFEKYLQLYNVDVLIYYNESWGFPKFDLDKEHIFDIAKNSGIKVIERK